MQSIAHPLRKRTGEDGTNSITIAVAVGPTVVPQEVVVGHEKKPVPGGGKPVPGGAAVAGDQRLETAAGASG